MPFNNEINQLTTQTKNHASVFNEVNNQLLENTKYNKEQHKLLQTQVNDLEQSTQSITWDKVTGKPEAYPAQAHNHGWESVQNKPITFPPISHTHNIADIEGLDGNSSVEWVDIVGKPTTFPPSTHTHTASQITGLPTSLPANGGNADTVDGKHATDFAYRASVNDNFSIGKYVFFYDYDDNGDVSTRKKAYVRDGVWNTDLTEIKIGALSVSSEITGLKQSVSSGKSAIATAITGKGISATGSEDFASLANKIGRISSMSLQGVNDLLILFLDNAFTSGNQMSTTLFDYISNMCTVYYDSAPVGNFKQIYLPANTLCYVTGTYISANAYGKRYYKSGTNNKSELMFSTRSDFRVQPFNSSESITVYTLDLNKFIK